MARPTNTEIIRELEKTVAILGDRTRSQLEPLQAELRRLDAAQVKMGDALTETRVKQAATDAKVEELRKTVEEYDRRRWQMLLMFVGSLLALIANVMVWAVRR